MNKKHIIVSSVIMSLIAFLAFFSVALSWFFLSSSAHARNVEDNGDAICNSLLSKHDYYSEMIRFDGLDNFEISYFTDDNLKSTSDSLGEVVVLPSSSYLSEHLNKTYQEQDPKEKRDFYYHLYFIEDDGIYVRYGEVVPLGVLLAKNFLIYGSIVVVAADLIYLILTFRQLEVSMNSLKIQVQKLQNVGGLSPEVVYHDDLEFYSKIIRDSRKELESQLSEAKSKAKETDFILDSFIEAMVVIDQDANIVVFNEKASEILGVPKADALHRNFRVINNPSIVKNLSVVSKTGIRTAFDLKIEGRVYHCEIESIVFDVAGNKSMGAALLMLDVTDEYNSAAMKRDFFANASHELKSPLTAILGYQEMIEEGVLTSKEELADANKKTVEEAERMNKIIMDMLALSSLENENLRPVERINVSRTIDDLLSLHEAEIKKKNITLLKDKGILFAMINPDDCERLFDNMITNAIKYNKEGGLIQIKINEVERSVIILDTGIGIAKEDQARIFERFYRVDKARSRKEMGTGLGLAIVKYIVSYYDIGLTLESTLGVGSTFKLTFPAINDAK
jgi:two-component system, OmpR family, phosphate regulon sensor histidine kinase PhoR